MREEAVEVQAYSGNFTKVMEWDATIITLVRFASGAIGKIGCVLEGNTPYTFNVRLHGPKGTLVNNRFYSHLLPGQTGWAEFPTILPDTPQVTHHPFQPEIDHFIDCILNDATPLVDIKDAVKTHEIMFAAEISANERRPVSLPLP
jgi:predicted dehydrogenase